MDEQLASNSAAAMWRDSGRSSSPYVITPSQSIGTYKDKGSLSSDVGLSCDDCPSVFRERTKHSALHNSEACTSKTSAEFSAVSTELMCVTLEEENERLRAALAAERRARQHAETELGLQVARARGAEQRAQDALAKLAIAERRLADLDLATSGQARVGTWLLSTPTDCENAIEAACATGTVDAACSPSSFSPLIPTPARAVDRAEPAWTPQSQHMAAALGTMGVSPRDCTVVCSTSILAGEGCDTRSGEVSLDTCLHASDLELSVEDDDGGRDTPEMLQLDDATAAVPLQKPYSWRRTDSGMPAERSCEAASMACTLERSSTFAGTLSSDTHGSLRQQPSEEKEWRQLALLSMAPSSRMLGPGALSLAANIPRPPAGRSKAAVDYGTAPALGNPRERSADGQNWPPYTRMSMPGTLPAFSIPTGQPLNGDRARMLMSSSLRLLAVNEPLGAPPNAPAGLQRAATAEVGSEWCNIPLGSPTRTPRKPAGAEVAVPALE